MGSTLRSRLDLLRSDIARQVEDSLIRKKGMMFMLPCVHFLREKYMRNFGSGYRDTL